MLKKIKVVVLILWVILISLIAFCGVFIEEKGIWNNLVPEYTFGMDLAGARQLKYVLNTEEKEKYVYVDENGNVMGEVWEDGSATTAEHETEHAEEENETSEEVQYAKETRIIKANPDENLTKENFELAKKIIQKRLKEQKVSAYDIRIDDITGQLVIETENKNDNVDKVEDLVSSVGKFQIVDYQNGIILMDNSDIKNVSVVTSNNSGYSTYLQIEFNKAGSEKLREISNKYVETKIEKTEDSEEEKPQEVDEEGNVIIKAEEEGSEDDTEKKYISIVIDDTTMMTTYFGEEMSNGILQISVGNQEKEYEKFIENYNSAQLICDTLNSGIMPIDYELESDNFVNSEINSKTLNTLKILSIIAIVIISLVFIIRFRKSGILASILGIGYIATLSVIIRYTNAIVSEGSIIAYSIVSLMNYIFMYMFLKNKNDIYTNIIYKFYLTIIPLIVVAVVFTLMTPYEVSSIGMAFFWGIILNVLYNFVFTRILLKK